jgi:FkbM family methyltransferase
VKIPEFWLADAVNESLTERRGIAADIGANVGDWSRAMAEEFTSVVAVEPDRRAYSQIGEIKGVTLKTLAIGEIVGEAELFLRESAAQNSLLEQHPIGGGGGCPAPYVAVETVEVTTLDELLPDGADFVKIDIEGGEVAALRGCKDLDRWEDAVFLVECHDTFAEVARELERIGKSVTRLPHPFPGHPGHCWAIGK